MQGQEQARRCSESGMARIHAIDARTARERHRNHDQGSEAHAPRGDGKWRGVGKARKDRPE